MRRKHEVVEALERNSNVLPAKEVRFVGWTQVFEKCRPNGKLCFWCVRTKVAFYVEIFTNLLVFAPLAAFRSPSPPFVPPLALPAISLLQATLMLSTRQITKSKL